MCNPKSSDMELPERMGISHRQVKLLFIHRQHIFENFRKPFVICGLIYLFIYVRMSCLPILSSIEFNKLRLHD